jgi:hypothetical protein
MMKTNDSGADQKEMSQPQTNRVTPESTAFRELTMGELTTYRPVIEQFVDSVGGNVDELFSRLMTGHAQCWALLAVYEGRTAPIGIAITKLLDDAVLRRRVLFVDMMSAIPGVDQAAWAYAERRLLTWGKVHGARRVEFLIVNDALMPRIADMGYKKVGTLVAKDL